MFHFSLAKLHYDKIGLCHWSQVNEVEVSLVVVLLAFKSNDLSLNTLAIVRKVQAHISRDHGKERCEFSLILLLSKLTSTKSYFGYLTIPLTNYFRPNKWCTWNKLVRYKDKAKKCIKTSKMFTHTHYTHEFAHKTVHPTSYRFPNRTKTERPIRDKYRDHAKRADWDEVYKDVVLNSLCV